MDQLVARRSDYRALLPPVVVHTRCETRVGARSSALQSHHRFHSRLRYGRIACEAMTQATFP